MHFDAHDPKKIAHGYAASRTVATATAILIVYVLVGPLPWLLLVALMPLARSRMTRLEKSHYPLPANPPTVTVLVPAKDEEGRIRICIEGVLALEYPRMKVVAIDDRSTDRTGAILDELSSKQSGKLSVVHIKELPRNWLGKCHALHVATGGCNSDWLLFVDSDVHVQPKALHDALATCIHRKYDALSISTRLECHSFLERLMLPLCAGTWAIAFGVSRTNNDNSPEIAAANGQFFLVRRAAYETVGGHETVRNQIVEDVELMRSLKHRGFRTRLFFGKHLASARMHTNFDQMLHGWGRIFAGTARMNPLPLLPIILFLLICGLSVYPALTWGMYRATQHNWMWLWASGVHFAAMTYILFTIYHGSGNHRRYALLFPIGVPMLVLFVVYAIRTCLTRQVLWRGTRFSAVERAR